MGDRTSSTVKHSSGCDTRRGSVEEAPEAPTSGPPFVTYSELLQLAQRRHCHGIHTEPVLSLCRPEKNFWVFKATVYKSAKCRGFVGYGDAHPGNVSPLIFNHAEMRMAETRAVNRALRKAYGIGICSVEEIGSFASPSQTKREAKNETRKLPPHPVNVNGSNGKGEAPVRKTPLMAALQATANQSVYGIMTASQVVRRWPDVRSVLSRPSHKPSPMSP